jgi:hypothetical protein
LVFLNTLKKNRTMRKKLIIIILLLSVAAYAQNERHEKIEALKTAYITNELDLTVTEAEKFWPIYNAFDNRLREIRKTEGREIFGKLKDGVENLSDEEANILIDKGFLFESETLKLHKELTQSLRKVIPPKKIIKLRKTEEDFKRHLLDRYREHRKGRK